MRNIILVAMGMAFAIGASAQGTFLCVAQCGIISGMDDVTQGTDLFIVMASGQDEPTAWENLQAKCPKGEGLYNGVQLYVYPDSNGAYDLAAESAPVATPDNSCTEL